MAHMPGLVAEAVGAAMRGNQPAAAPVVQRETYTEEQLAEMIDTGGAQAVKAHRYIAAATVEPLRERVDQQWAQTVHMGQNLAVSSVRPEEIPYYTDPAIKREVDRHLANLDPAQRADRNAIILAHNFVVAQPENLKRIVDQQVAERMRAAQGAAGVTDPATGTTTRQTPTTRTEGIPTVEELLGQETAQALARQGQDGDQFARRMGYANWEDYYKKTELTPEQQRFHS